MRSVAVLLSALAAVASASGAFDVPSAMDGLAGEVRYRIAIIADKDIRSRVSDSFEWHSWLITGTLVRRSNGSYALEWDNLDAPRVVSSTLSEKGRGMELSDLCVWNGRLYSVDDRSGTVFEINVDTATAVPRFMLTDGSGEVAKGFKAEWMTVKDGQLVVGGMGKEWADLKGNIVHLNPQWIKTIDTSGQIRHINWINEYEALRVSTGTSYPGYLLHESAIWSQVRREWLFLPRRVSTEAYCERKDEARCGNDLLMTDESFTTIRRVKVGDLNLQRGFSSFKAIPFTDDRELIALKTEEVTDWTTGEVDVVASYVTIVDTDGNVLLKEEFVIAEKFEGIEFIDSLSNA